MALTDNTTTLRAILDAVNALPEASTGVDWTAAGGDVAYAVQSVSGVSYNFTALSDGYYESTNQGVKSSAAMCKVSFTCDSPVTLSLNCINYAETKYDYGVLSVLDTELDTTATTSYQATSNIVYKTFYNQQSPDVVTVDYGVIDPGSHFIYVKYRKDSSTDSNNDSLKFKVVLRKTSAKDSISYALESKGVTVPADVEIDDVAGLINNIAVSSGVATCTVTYTANANALISYSAYENGSVVTKTAESKSLTLSDVVCGSAIHVTDLTWMGIASYTKSDNVGIAYNQTSVSGIVFSAPTASGASGTITVTTN